ncbi:DUF2218 domain-containing protein [Nocardia aurantia]|uniref:DUF2218 domain-containing protein n=1 Tax=Nocardia aurantia TaxID=2585199 RepID=A0A7K0DXN5_9NOCA|nr:DUF2218 domain-containing protein [Nocardia aurantia]MQY30471.1 hypothetical protein [Nocardia aurantia]
MPVLHARIATDRSARYLAQFCRHAAAMGDGRAHRFRGHGAAGPVPPADEPVQAVAVGGGGVTGGARVTAQWDDTTGQVIFDPWGRADLTAGPGVLSIRLDAVDEAAATRLCAVIAADLHRFGRLSVEWVAAETDCAAEDPK